MAGTVTGSAIVPTASTQLDEDDAPISGGATISDGAMIGQSSIDADTFARSIFGWTTTPSLTIVHDRSSVERNARVTSDAAPWVDYVIRRLDTLAVEEGGPRLELINRARGWILTHLPPSASAPSVLPSEDGGVDFVWHQRGWNIEITAEPDNQWSVWSWNRHTDEEFAGALEEHCDEVLDLIRLVSRRDG